MARVKAEIKPELLVWARESAGFSIDEGADKLKQDSYVNRAWDRGTDQPLMDEFTRHESI